MTLQTQPKREMQYKYKNQKPFKHSKHKERKFFLYLTLLTSRCRSNANLDAAIVTSDLQPI